MPDSTPAPPRQRVVIVGAGFAGLSAAKGLAKGPFDVTVIDRYNYHLFQPLLYQVATAGLSPADIAAPIRSVLARDKSVHVVLGIVSAVDTQARHVVAEGREIPYDRLILATGARHAYFGHEEWAEAAPGIKTIDDATALRRRILLAFENAETESDPAERQRLLTFVIVGGGPTGVELAGAIVELATRALAADFRAIDPRAARVKLVEAGPRLLTSFDPDLSEKAKQALEKIGVEVLLDTPVTGCDAFGVMAGGKTIEARTLAWAAGVRASRAGKWVGAETDRAGRVKVGPDLSVPGQPDVFCLGDTALVIGADGKPVPGVAPAAKQQGQYVAKLLCARAAGGDLPAFRYADYGNMATIGRKAAIAQIGRVKFSGFPAWLMWSLAHVYFLIGFKNRLVVMLSWIWAYATYHRGTRLITGRSGRAMHGAADAKGAGKAV